MKLRTTLAVGFFAGMIVGGGVTLLDVAPGMVAVLMKPLEWLTEGLRPYPRESPANLIIAFPLIFVYWGCVGSLVAFLLRVACRLCLRERTKREKPKSPGNP